MNISPQVLTLIGFVIGSLIQAASFGYFLGGLTARVKALEKQFELFIERHS